MLDTIPITSIEDLQYLEEIAYQRGVLVRDGRLDGADARLLIRGNRAIVTISSETRSAERRRFSIAHELGHFELHRDAITLQSCASEDIGWEFQQSIPDLEIQANEFASEFLMPERYFAQRCQDEPSLDAVAELASLFRVSLTAASIRFTSFCAEPIVLVFTQDRRIKWFRGSKEYFRLKDDLRLAIRVNELLNSAAYADRIFDGHRISRKPREVAASAWFSGRYNRDAHILEQSWHMPTFNAVLTLLWIDDDLEGEDEDVWMS